MKYTVAVRALAEFTAKQGDLDLRFTPSPTAQEGIAGHATVAARRAADYRHHRDYESEIALQGEYGNLLVRGRADGYSPGPNRLEEIKTHRGDVSRIPANHRHLHWAQAKIYGWLLCQQRGLQEIHLALVYFDIGSQKETVLIEKHSADALRAYFEQQCERFTAWAQQEMQHRAARDEALTALRFPHASFRTGQRELAEAAYRTATGGHCLMAQAPTGIGKTMGTVFPMLKACPGQKIDKIFFLAAKTSGRGLALKALALLTQDAAERTDAPALPLRTLELIARDKACEHPDKACHGESCPLAQGFYDRLPQARQAALEHRLLDREALRAVALDHQVCPYYLSQELTRWCDIVVGDYNYYFDSSAMLHALTASNQWRIAVLIDEAHNLVDRARRMYTAELEQTGFRALRRAAPPVLKKSLNRLNREWNAANRDQGEAAYRCYEAVPEALATALQQAVSAMTDYFAEHPATVDAPLQQFYFDALHFARMCETFGAHSLFDITIEDGRDESMLCIRNVVPAPFLRPRFDSAHATVLFSATLTPWHFYTDLLGLSEQTMHLEVASPFQAEQLTLEIASRISTRYRDRERSLQPIVDLICRQYAARPGNYLAFFSSFAYLEQVFALLQQQHPAIPVWEQSRRMAESEREHFIARFVPGGRGIGFAVLGGAFGEGIDLPGDRLVGAFIATLGLPQLNPVNEHIRQRMEDMFGDGYDYTYLYPGLQKVVQAAGRVIRSQSDQGSIHLIDDRFARPEVRALLPGWWPGARRSASP